MERIIEFNPAFDKRDPDPKKNFGIHGVEMRWILKGDKGAVQFVVYTNWQLPHIMKDMKTRMLNATDIDLELRCFWQPMAADLGYHSKVPLYEGQLPMGAEKVDIKENPEKAWGGLDRFTMTTTKTGTFDPCPYLDGAPCYYDGSGLHAEEVLKMLIEKGGEAVWKYMEECYHEKFDEVEVVQ